jgi:Amt family ammonium transporter
LNVYAGRVRHAGGGFCRAKNGVNLMTKNLMDFVIGSLSFFFIGYALMMG